MGCTNARQVEQPRPRAVPVPVMIMSPTERMLPPRFTGLCNNCRGPIPVAFPPGMDPEYMMDAQCPHCRSQVRFIATTGRRGADLHDALMQQALASSEVIRRRISFPREKFDSSRHKELVECEICLENYADGDELQRLPCMHVFHNKCISQWLDKSRLCPVCDTDVVKAAMS
eukprot:TRINITY_DN66183_c0_g1_i1.p1 TRINITY_DN66183_c0_g1~~TRINITY_DN66183_c0_g1_i1.p1  ORF type:complete len:172 (-),score=20.25 TRINITY_DN66183_c0_g1_i1:379-894(-)